MDSCSIVYEIPCVVSTLCITVYLWPCVVSTLCISLALCCFYSMYISGLVLFLLYVYLWPCVVSTLCISLTIKPGSVSDN